MAALAAGLTLVLAAALCALGWVGDGAAPVVFGGVGVFGLSYWLCARRPR